MTQGEVEGQGPETNLEPPTTQPSVWQGLAFYIAILCLLAFTLMYALSENWRYVSALGQILTGLSFHFGSIDSKGLPQALVATFQIFVIGTLIQTTIVPRRLTSAGGLFGKVSSLAFGFAVVGLSVTLLSELRLLYLWSTEAMIATVTVAFVISRKPWAKNGKRELGQDFVRIWKIDWSQTGGIEWAVFATIACLALLTYYDAVFFPIAETDSIIYHASAAAIAFNGHGMPLISGGGVGLGSSGNYPLLFSYLGSYYYLFVGAVNDIYLRALAPTMWLLSILTTYLIGRQLGGRKVAAIAALLIAAVPSYISYAFQATEETTATLFLALGFLFLLLGLSERAPLESRYFVGAGIIFGAACLTSYQALYFMIPLLVVLAVEVRRGRVSVRNFLAVMASLLLVGSAPYIRNAIVLHDPVYPFLSNLFPSLDLSRHLFSVTQESWTNVAYSLVNPVAPTLSGFVAQLPTYQSFYPLNLTLLVPALLLLLILPVERKRTLVAFILIPSLLILALFAPFVRYFWLELPFFAVAVASVFAFAQEGTSSAVHTMKKWSRGLARYTLPLMLSLLLIFPSFVVLGQQNYTFIPFNNAPPPGNYLQYFTHPGVSSSVVLANSYGSDVSGWYWLESRLQPNQRVATFETRTYYLNFSLRSPDSLFYLDSAQAAPLYNLTSYDAALEFMRNEGIQFVFVRIQDWTSTLFEQLPFTYDLGSPRFPLLFANGLTQVFAVGPVHDSIIESGLQAYTYGLTNSSLPNGAATRIVPVNDTSPRLYIETNNRLVNAEIKYLDSGVGSLTVNIFDPAANAWLYEYVAIAKHDTGRMLSHSFLVPSNLAYEYTEFGLSAFGSNFTIAQITANHVSQDGREPYPASGLIRVSNLTTPKSVMMYLPILEQGDSLHVQAVTQPYNFSIEVFAGYIPLNQSSGWWLGHENVARSPPLSMAYGTRNPTLEFQVTKANVYTLVIVWWDKIPESTIDVAISVALTTTG